MIFQKIFGWLCIICGTLMLSIGLAAAFWPRHILFGIVALLAGLYLLGDAERKKGGTV